MFNSAKNKYEYDEDIKNNSLTQRNISAKLTNNEETNSFNGSDSLGDSTSTAIISRDSNGSNKSNNVNNAKNCFKNCNEGFLGGKNIPDEKKLYNQQNNDDSLTLQIKYAMNKMRLEYLNNKINSNNSLHFNNFCEFYLGNCLNDVNSIQNYKKQDNNNSFNKNYNNYSINQNGFI